LFMAERDSEGGNKEKKESDEKGRLRRGRRVCSEGKEERKGRGRRRRRGA